MPMIDASFELKAMIEAAQAAGTGLQRRQAMLSELVVDTKQGPTDLVSIADREAEDTTHVLLSRARPS